MVHQDAERYSFEYFGFTLSLNSFISVLLLMVGYCFRWSYTQLLKAAERQAS